MTTRKGANQPKSGEKWQGGDRRDRGQTSAGEENSGHPCDRYQLIGSSLGLDCVPNVVRPASPLPRYSYPTRS